MNKLLTYVDWGFCLVIIPLMTFIFPVGRWVSDRPSYAVLLVGILYLDYFVVRKYTVSLFFRERRNRVVSFLTFLCLFVCVFILTYYHEGWPFYRLSQIYPTVDMTKVQMSQQRVWLAFLTIHLFGATVSLHEEVSRQHLRQQAIRHERDRAALALYRAQLNPHFLYNTLNSLYGLIVTHSDRTEQAFVQFTELTRVITTHVDKDSITVELSQQFLRNFIDLQKLRIRPDISISFTYESDDSRAQIAPMILFTFVENALKHGTAVGLSGSIDFLLKVSGGVLTFTADNPMVEHSRETGCGTGLKNCRHRLQLLYPNRHQLIITQGGGRYDVLLTIRLQ
ncbi:MAG: histidine kinase [Prevotella sp.]|nr:histidine kinase [Prevotella sp.]